MRFIDVDNVRIQYAKEKHIKNLFEIAHEFRLLYLQAVNARVMIIPEGEPDYTYLIVSDNGNYRINTRRLDITPDRRIFRNLIAGIEYLDPVVDINDCG